MVKLQEAIARYKELAMRKEIIEYVLSGVERAKANRLDGAFGTIPESLVDSVYNDMVTKLLTPVDDELRNLEGTEVDNESEVKKGREEGGEKPEKRRISLRKFGAGQKGRGDNSSRDPQRAGTSS